jgi:hypothetical protein
MSLKSGAYSRMPHMVDTMLGKRERLHPKTWR